jgi:Leucine-rich repeat (LRR) protein
MTSDAVLKIIEQAAAEGWQTLDLSRRELTEIPKEIYKLKNLTQLNLSSNQISEIPDTIPELKNLKILVLDYNQISEIPDAIAELKNLTTLDLSSNQISAISDTITELKNLTNLILRRNQISEIPDAIAELKNLTSLILGQNRISEIPDAISELKNLTKLDLSLNQISEIPDAIAELKNLTQLNLCLNQISEISHAISELKNLTTLDLSFNQISEIPEEILQLKKLEDLDLAKNPIKNDPMKLVQHGIYAIRHHHLLQELSYYQNNNPLQIERSIEFPPEYWTAGNSILSYFSHILSVKYPNQNIKVKIEQEGLLLRMIIDTPEGSTETIEQTFNDYVMVISRQLPPESLLTDPFEVMALKNKLQIAEMELRISRENFAAFKDDSHQRINSLEMQVSQLFSIIGQSLQKDNHITVNLTQELSNQQGTGDNIGNDKVGNDKIGRDKIERE